MIEVRLSDAARECPDPADQREREALEQLAGGQLPAQPGALVAEDCLGAAAGVGLIAGTLAPTRCCVPPTNG